MTEILGTQMSFADLASPFGKMFRELCPAELPKEQTSQRSSRNSSALPNRKLPVCKCLRRDGQQQDAITMSWEDGALLGEYSTASTGDRPTLMQTDLSANAERRNGVGESRLSQILQDCAPQKYYLSARACQGILNRAERRGKELPEVLRTALEEQAKA